MTRVGADHVAPLSVDRIKFAELITKRIEAHPNIEVVREEVTNLDMCRQDAGVPTIIATGPLTSNALTAEIMRFTGDDQLYFYDAIAPIIAADSIDMSVAWKAAREEAAAVGPRPGSRRRRRVVPRPPARRRMA